MFGAGVILAARLDTLAAPCGICLSGTVYDHVKSKIDAQFSYRGLQQVKNIADPVQVYALSADGTNPLSAQHERSETRNRATLFVQPFRVYADNDPTLDMLAEVFGEDLEIAFTAFHGLKAIVADDIATPPTADYILKTSMRARQDEVTLNVQIVHLPTATCIWADRLRQPRAMVLDGDERLLSKITATANTQIVVHAGGEKTRFEDDSDRADHMASQALGYIYGLTEQSLSEAERLSRATLSLAPYHMRAFQTLALVKHHIFTWD